MGKRRRKPQRQVSQEYFPEEFAPAVVAEVESLFKRCFDYSELSEGQWCLPPTEKWMPGCSFTDESLESYKRELNEAKSSLSDYDINKWQKHTNATNRAGLVMSHLRYHRKPELCTQAWCKFHEILHNYPVLPSPMDALELNTLHLCEAPGAFISSLNHFIICQGYGCTWQWRASTLNPYYEGNGGSEMISEDSFIRETLDHWLFGADDTGDVMSLENVLNLKESAREIAPVMLVTADGSIDCQNSPSEQEGSTSPLHLAEVVAALHVLAPGGSLVLKMFTLFESCSFSLLYLLNCLFDKVSVCKPATSKSGNSEVYVVCIGFKGVAEEQLRKLNSALGQESVTLFSRDDLPEDFVAQHRSCVQLFTKLQLQTIQENRKLHQNTSPEVQQRIDQTQRCCAATFMTKFNVKTIPHWQRIVDSGKETFHKSRHWRKPRVLRHVGSYNDRQKELSLPWGEQVEKMAPFHVEIHFATSFEGYGSLSTEMLSQWTIVTGKPYEDIKSSKFCDGAVLQRFTGLLCHSKSNVMDDAPSLADLESAMATMELLKGPRVVLVEDDLDAEVVPVMCLDEDFMTCPLVNRLKELYGDKVSMVTSANRDQFEQILIIPKMRQSKTFSLAEMQSHMLTQLIEFLQTASDGDHLIFPVSESVTRFSAGIVFTLQCLFEKILIITSTSGLLPYFLIGLSFQRPSNDLLTYLSEVKQKVTMSTILQFVPIHYLCESNFFQFICQVNNETLKRSANCLLNDQKKTLEEKSSEVERRKDCEVDMGPEVG